MDDHHIDCRYGEVSGEVVPLCRRCHTTYHSLGVGWFDDDVLDKAIIIENKCRALRGMPEIKRENVTRSDYWKKKHSDSEKKVALDPVTGTFSYKEE